ncbi:MAG TPA: cupin domain-containing protein [Rhodanobacteraceae bacterium]|nr:cupin domain-containing protein [Rhodanobacteraceae bacterium]
MSAARPPVLNVDDAPFTELAELSRMRGSSLPDARYGGRIAPLGLLLGARKLGYNLTVIAPGKRAFPFHNHRVNEEMFLVLEGRGHVRIGERRLPIRPGDFIACPAGGGETAHQLVNDSDAELKVLAVSGNQTPEICEYPDSGKFSVLAEFDNDAGGRPHVFAHIGRTHESHDYWEDE